MTTTNPSESVGDCDCGTTSKQKPSMMQKVRGQFRRPHGLLGRLAGWIMGTRPSNLARNRWTIDLLDLQPGDHLLELGFGPGVAIEAAAAKIRSGAILGIDHSELMVQTATKRNRAAIDAGTVSLRCGTLDDLRAEDGPFDKMLSVNCAQFWDDTDGTLTRLCEALRPGGTLAITYQPHHAKATSADADRFAERISDLAESSGFRDVRTEKLDLNPVPAVCVLLTR